MSLETEIQRGPRGGNLLNPNNHPERREAHYEGEVVSGVISLHSTKKVSMPGLLREQGWHRMAAFMMLSGVSNKDIASSANVTVAHISNLKAQTWFQEILATLADEQGKGILGILKSELMASVQKLVELRDNAESPRVQLAAATTLLEHGNGKAIQQVLSVVSHQQYGSASEEERALRAELETLRGQSGLKDEAAGRASFVEREARASFDQASSSVVFSEAEAFPRRENLVSSFHDGSPVEDITPPNSVPAGDATGPLNRSTSL